MFCSVTVWGGDNDPIIFADANVKTLCVTNWDTDGDGELSEAEAAAVNDIGTVFQNQAEITSFSEFKYFTGVTTIGEYALSGCTSLSTIEFPSSLQSFQRYACYNSKFEEIIIPDNVTSIGNSAFRNCTALSSIKLGSNSVSFGKNVFRYCINLTSITFDGTECHFNGEDAFRDCNSLTSLIITDVSAWCKSSFYSNSNPLSKTKSLLLQTSDNDISVIKDLVIPDDVTTINNYAFYMCESLESVVISNNVTSIGSYAFYGCSNLTSVTVKATEPIAITSYVFSNCTNATLYVPSGCKDAYGEADYWKEFKEIVTPLANGDTFTATTTEGIVVIYQITNSDLKQCQVGYNYEKKKGMRTAIANSTSGEISIPSIVNGYTVKGIGDYAFWECKDLTSIVIPEGITFIGQGAFGSCKSITSLVIPDGVTSIGESAFNNCTNAVTISIPNSVRGDSFGDYVFAGCVSLTAINIPEGVSRIGSCAFRSCKSLEAVTIPSTVSIIYEFAFEGCTSLSSVTLSENMKYIGTSAFSGSCITSLTLPKTFTTSYSLNNISYSGTDIGSISTLKKVIIHKGVGSLYEVFRYCPNIETIICYNEEPVNAYNCWKYAPYPVLYVPEGSKEAYMADENWNKLTIVEMKPLSFADVNVKSICVSNWDTDGDGEINQLEVAEITDLGQVFNNKTDISSFDEFKYFTSLTEIGENVFTNCSGLSSIAIPGTVKSIANNAFVGCNSLTSVSVDNHVPCPLASNAFPNRANATLYVPAGSKAAYSAADYWKEFKTIVEIDASLMNITFADAAVKTLCVSKPEWDTNGDGELNMAEAAAITDLGNTFFNKNIRSFNELQYFSGLSIVGEETFRGCRLLESVVLPQTVTTIDKYAFDYCEGLSNIIIPSQVTAINDGAFQDCSALSSIIIPSSVTSIGIGAFTSCSGLNSIIVEEGNQFYDSRENCNALIETATNTFIKGTKSTIIPNDITTIGASAFYNVQGLTDIAIPLNVTSIGSNAFSGCKDLTSITLPEGVTSIEYSTFYGCTGLTSLTLPHTLTKIEDSAFGDCINLKTITIPEGVSSIGYNAFKNCKALESIILPSSINSIKGGAFQDCSNISSVTIKRKKPVSIDSYSTFQYRSNATLYVPYGCKADYEAASYWKEFKEIIEMPSPTISFSDASVKAICVANWDTDKDGELSEAEAEIITDLGQAFKGNTQITSFDELKYFTALTAISESEFEGCSDLVSIILPENITSIGNSAFSGCNNLASVTIPKNVSAIGNSCFSGCGNLSSVAIPNGVTTIENSVFSGCSKLVSVTIPYSVTTIGDNAFASCSSLAAITIPGNVTTVGDGAFQNCNLLTTVTAEGNIPADIIETTFPNRSNSTLNVLLGNKAAYQAANYWNEFKDIIEIIPAIITFADANVKSLCVAKWDTNKDGELSGEEAGAVTDLGSVFYMSSITSFDELRFFTGLTSISNGAFSSCGKLTSVTLPNSVTDIGYCVFSSCGKLTSVTIPNSVTNIGEAAFHGCSNLTSVSIPDGVTSIGSSAFYGCSGLTSIEIPNSVTSIGNYAFEYCSGLTSITIPDGVTNIGSYVFSSCRGLTSVSIPNSVTSIGEYAFNYCSNLTSVTIPNSVTSIGKGAFRWCNLASVTVESNNPVTISSDVFDSRAYAILYVPAGSKAAYEAADYWKEFKMIIEKGDADGDGFTDVNDVTSTINHILNKPVSSFFIKAADVDGDGVIDVNDVQSIIYKALGK